MMGALRGGWKVAGATALLPVVLLDVTKGEHAIRIVTDPRDETAEHDESDNTFEALFTWNRTAPDVPPPASFTDDQIDALLGQLSAALDNPRPVLGEASSGLEALILVLAEPGISL